MNRHCNRCAAFSSLLAALLLGGCNTVPTEDPYLLYRQHMPRSILVLPPVNESQEVNAPYSWVTTVSKPIAELGYYVFPVAIVDAFMKDNGLPNPEDMHDAPLDKLGEVFGADAVLYVTLTEFGQKFELLSSTTRVDSRAELVDIDTGQTIWQGELHYADSGHHDSQNSLLGNLINAAITQVSGTLSDRSHEAAIIANSQLFTNSHDGLLKGPRHPGFDAQMAAAREAAEKRDAETIANEEPQSGTLDDRGQQEKSSP